VSYWIAAISGIIGFTVFYYLVRKHTEKDLINEIKLKQGEESLKKLNETRDKEIQIDEKYDRRKEYLLKSNIIDWPDSGVIELPKENNRSPSKLP
jgi:hypothetical protein